MSEPNVGMAGKVQTFVVKEYLRIEDELRFVTDHVVYSEPHRINERVRETVKPLHPSSGRIYEIHPMR